MSVPVQRTCMPPAMRRHRSPVLCLGRDGADYLRWLVCGVANRDHDAFHELVDRLTGPVEEALRQQLPDPGRATGTMAGTFVEV